MFATLHLPDFFLQAALRHRAELRNKPAAVLDDRDRKPILLQITPAAAALGIAPGMTPSQGLARSLQLVVLARERGQERVVQDILLEQAFTLAPLVENTAPGIATVQFTDFRFVEEKTQEAVARLRNLEISAQAGIAQNRDTSYLAAFLADPVLMATNDRKFLAPLPIETLCPAGLWGNLGRAGFEPAKA